MKAIRNTLLLILRPIIELLGKIHFPFTHKRFHGEDYYKIQTEIIPGTLFFTTTRGEISNFFNSSDPKHGAIYVGGDPIRYVIEAVGKGVVKTNLVSFLMSKDDVVVIRPLFANSEEMEKIAKNAFEYLGKKYDTAFEPNDDKYYCTELLVKLYNDAFPGIRFSSTSILGVKTYLAQDIINDKNHWEIIYDNRKKQGDAL